jgi:hypothetical protein
VIAAGCAADTQAAPHRIDPESVPFELLEKAPPPDVKSEPSPFSIVVYLVGPEGLVAAARSAPAPLSVAKVVRALVQGLTDAERAAGLRTRIPAGTTVRHLQIAGPVVLVDLGGTFGTATGKDRIVGVAQIVATVAHVVPDARIRFRLHGRAIETPRGDGTLTGEAVGIDDYPPDVIERLVIASNPSAPS